MVLTGKKGRLKKQEKYLLYGTALVLGYVIWSKIRAIGNLVFSPGNVTGIEFQGSVPFIYFTVYVQNTASTGITVDSFAGNIFADGNMIGNISNFTPVYISPNSQTVIPVVAQLGMYGIIETLISAFRNGDKTRTIDVRGYANGVGIQVPVNIKLFVGG